MVCTNQRLNGWKSLASGNGRLGAMVFGRPLKIEKDTGSISDSSVAGGPDWQVISRVPRRFRAFQSLVKGKGKPHEVDAAYMD